MRHLLARYLNDDLSRRGLFEALAGLGFTAAAAQSVVAPAEASETGQGASSVKGTGGEIVVAQMKAAGVKYLFTNPGSFEVGFFDAFLGQDHTQLIMGLHEGIVISLADGYHRTAGKPGFVNIHVIAGTAQAAGQMYNAAKDGSALVVTAGLNDNELWSDDAGLAPRPGFDQKEINRQFTKISWESRDPRSLALMLRRAFKVATAPPGGPTYLAMAHHTLEARDVEARVLPGERFMPEFRMRPAKDAVERASKALVEARRPVIVAGDEVWKSRGCGELLRLAEALGLPVTNQGQGYDNFPAHHPQNLGRFNQNHKMLAGCDLILSVGAPDFGGRVVPGGPEAPLAAKFIRLTANGDVISRNYPTDLALAGTPREGLRDLSEAVESLTTEARRRKIAKPRAQELAAYTTKARDMADTAARANFGQAPVHPDELGAAIAAAADADAIIVPENLTAKFGAFPFGHREGEMMRVANTGNGLGWGIGAAAGAKLAEPDRQVICSIGDGSVMYSAAGFWTQARYEIPVLTVVSNNRNYQTVRRAYHRYGGKMAESDQYTGMYLGDPDISFAELARSQGVAGEKVNESSELRPALKRGVEAVREGRPYVVDVETARYGGGAVSEWHQKFSLAERRTRSV
ncbi:MAG: thiamine pyrophosphate-binding protein [Bryobacterales bacterium]|nr:thiamine pyrophosphate-binding protein [Bryobacterales bacterium]